jgi:RNA polymerase sigma factor (sigma-70 family)
MSFPEVALAESASDERLIELSSGGSETAFDAIVERYQALLLRHCTRMLGEAGAQDAVQDTFLTAWSALRGGAKVHALRAWLFTIAHRKALRELGERRGAWVELPESLSDGLSCADEADQSARMRDVLVSVAALPTDERDALLHSAVHGGSGRQIAGELGVDESTVRQLVFRARATVRAAAAACLLPPALSARFARAIAGATRRAGNSRTLSNAEQVETTGRLLKFGVTAMLATALVGSGALHVIDSHHRAPLTPPSASRAASHAQGHPGRLVVAARHAQDQGFGGSQTPQTAGSPVTDPAEILPAALTNTTHAAQHTATPALTPTPAPALLASPPALAPATPTVPATPRPLLPAVAQSTASAAQTLPAL